MITNIKVNSNIFCLKRICKESLRQPFKEKNYDTKK